LARVKTHLELRQKHLELKQKTLELKKRYLEIEEKNKELEEEEKKSKELLLDTIQKNKRIDEILNNILPSEIAEELKKYGEVKPYPYKKVSVLFTDFVNFSKISKEFSPGQLMEKLGIYFSTFEKITKKWEVEKIKTIGDSFMGAGGLPRLNKSNPIQTVLAGLEIQQFIKDKNEEYSFSKENRWEVRIGIHTGGVIAGIVGRSKYSYDIWGDTVNVASRMESAGEAGKVNISGTTYEHVKRYIECFPRGKIKIKNMGEVHMYFVERIKPEFSDDEAGLKPNGEFKKIIETLSESKEI
jgi:class 3 adenylate cyclase